MTEQLTPSDGSVPEPPDADPPVDLRRVVAAVRRSGRLVAAVVVLVTATVLVASLTAPDRFRTTARIAHDPGPSETVDIETADRQLATSSELVTAPPVLEDAARRVPGETVGTLQSSVSANFDPAVSIVDIVVEGTDPIRIARVANGVAAAFLTETERVAGRVARRDRERLEDEIERLRKADASTATVELMRERLSEMAVSEVTADSGLRLVQQAAVPSAPYAPRPLRSVVLAFVAALLLGVLIAIARDHVRPAVPDAAGISRITGLPVVAALPAERRTRLAERVRRLLGSPPRPSPAVDQTIIEEAALQGAVRSALPPRGQRVVLVHGIDSYGTAQVAAGLTRSLAWGGHASVLVRFEEPGSPRQPLPDVPTVRCSDIDEQLDELRATDFRYVVVQSPRLARGTRLRPLAARSAAVILVARLGQASSGDAAAARRLIDALGLRGLGLALICSPGEIAGIVRSSLAAPFRAPTRARTSSQNGAHADAAGETGAEHAPSGR